MNATNGRIQSLREASQYAGSSIVSIIATFSTIGLAGHQSKNQHRSNTQERRRADCRRQVNRPITDGEHGRRHREYPKQVGDGDVEQWEPPPSWDRCERPVSGWPRTTRTRDHGRSHRSRPSRRGSEMTGTDRQGARDAHDPERFSFSPQGDEQAAPTIAASRTSVAPSAGGDQTRDGSVAIRRPEQGRHPAVRREDWELNGHLATDGPGGGGSSSPN